MVDPEDPEPVELSEEIEGQESDFESAQTHPKLVTVTDEDLRDLKKDAMEYKDKYLRLLADADNSRKRMQKEKQELTRYAIENVIVDFLPPLDNLENALKFAQEMSEEVRNWAFGFQMILTQFKDILAKNGVTSIDSLGSLFDPHLHEAIEMVETGDQPPGFIVEESIKGYKMADRVIRHARVKVAKGKNLDNESQIINQTETI